MNPDEIEFILEHLCLAGRAGETGESEGPPCENAKEPGEPASLD